MRIVMAEKGWCYKTEDGRISIKKSYVRTRRSYDIISSYKTVQNWTVYGLRQGYCYAFSTLAEAKRFVNENYQKGEDK